MNNTYMLIIYIVLFVGIFYFLAIRPQRRQKQQHQEMMSMLKRGDEVVTIGGVHGTVRKVGPDWVVLEVASRTQIKFLKRAISSITAPEAEEEDEYVEEEDYEDEDVAELEGADDEEYYAEEEDYDEAADEEAYEEEEAAESTTEAAEGETPGAPEAQGPKQ